MAVTASEDEDMLLDMVRDLAHDKVAPRAAEIDATRRVSLGYERTARQARYSGDAIPRGLWRPGIQRNRYPQDN